MPETDRSRMSRLQRQESCDRMNQTMQIASKTQVYFIPFVIATAIAVIFSGSPRSKIGIVLFEEPSPFSGI